MIVELTLDLFLIIFGVFLDLLPSLEVSPEIFAISDYFLNEFIPQAAGVVSYILGPVGVFIFQMGVTLMAARLIFNLLYFVFRWIPFLSIGGD